MLVLGLREGLTTVQESLEGESEGIQYSPYQVEPTYWADVRVVVR